MRIVDLLFLNRVCGRAVLAASVATVAVGLAACGGGSGAAAPAPAPAPTPEVPQAAWALKPVTDAALVEQLRTALDASNSPKALLNVTVMVAASPSAGSGAVADAAAAVSGTVLQEAGVDEADWVKSDGRSVFSVLPGSASAGGGDTVIERLTLPSSAATDPALKPVDKLASPLRNAAMVQGLYLDAERAQLVVLGERGYSGSVADRWFSPMSWVGGGTELAVVGTAGALATRYTLGISAQLVGSRRVGSVLYLVLRSRAQPQGFDAGWATPVTTTANTDKLATLKAADVLPTVSVNGGAASALLPPDSCLAAVKPAEPSADVITLVGLNLAASTPTWSARCFAGATETFYMSPNNLYLATTRWTYTQGATADAVVYPGDMATDIHQFALDGSGFSYQGSGTVQGHLGFDMNRKPWRLGEHKGVLRVATQTAQRWGGPVIALPVASTTTSTTTSGTTATAAATGIADSPVHLTLLKPDATKALAVVGTLPNTRRPAPLGKAGEQLYASRFVGDRAYLVTYRLTDPLYVLDLSDPTDPRVAGELEISGYSDYLFPLSERYLLGIGKDALSDGSAGDGRFAWYQGVKVSVIDVADPAKPLEVAREVIGRRGTDATVLRDHHGVALLPVGASAGVGGAAASSATAVRVALPVSLHEAAPFGGGSGASAYYGFSRTQLSRLEVNLTSGALQRLPDLTSADSATQRNISSDRALLASGQAHHYQNGRWASWRWD